jgi:hypothetical protein
MKLKIITPEDVEFRSSNDPTVRVNITSGIISFSAGLNKIIGIKTEDIMTFVYDEDSQKYYIAKSEGGVKGFIVKSSLKGDKETQYESLQLRATGLIKLINKHLNLKLDANTKGKNSHMFKIDQYNPVKHFGMTLYKLI